MAEILIGDVVARIRADATDFQRGIAQALQSLQQFQQALAQQSGTLQQGMAGSMRQMASSLQGIQQAQGQTTQSTQVLTQQLGAMGQALQNTGQQARTFGSVWQQALAVAGGIGLATSMQSITHAVVEFGTASVSLAARMQDLHRSFVALEGSGQAANRTLAFLFETARQNGVSFTELAEGFRRLEAGAKGTVLTTDDLERAMAGLSAGARTMGLSGSQVTSAIVALEQMLTKGRLSAEELVRQLGNAVPGGLSIMARALGTTTADLRVMAEAGIVPVTTAVTAFTEQMAQIGKSAGPLEGLTKTFADLRNETTAWMTAIGEGLGQTIKPFLDTLVQLSQQLRDLFQIRPPGSTAPQQPATGAAGWMGWAYQHLTIPGMLGAPAPFPFGRQGPAGQPMAPSPYTGMIQAAAGEFKIDPGLLSQLIRQESSFQPGLVSPKGAVGLGQIMPGTAEYLAPGIAAEQLKDPATSVRLAAKYLAEQLTIFKDSTDQVGLALAAYNAGPGNVAKAIQQATAAGRPETFAGIQPFLPRETQAYVPGVLSGKGGPAVQTPGLTPEGQAQVQRITQESVKQTLEDFGALQKQVQNLAASGANFNNVLGRDINREADRLVDKLTNISAFFARAPQAAGQMGDELRQQVLDATQQAVVWQSTLGLDAQRRDMLRQQVEAVEQLTIRRQAELVTIRQGQQEAERFTRLETARLQQQRVEDRPRLAGMTLQQQIADYENRLMALQDRANDFGAQLEAQRTQAMRPQLEAQLQQIETLMGRPGQSLAAQAAANVELQFAQARKSLEVTLQELARHPALQDLQEKFQNALQGLGEAAAQQSQVAFDRVNDQMRLRIEQMGDQIEQIGERIAGAGLDPLSAALAAIRREFAGMVNQLDAFQRALEELAKTATAERQVEIAAQLDTIEAIRQQTQEGRDRREAQARFRLEFLPSLEEPRAQSEELDAMRNQLEDMRIQRLNQQQGPFGMGRVQTRQERQMMERFTPENREEAEQLQAQLRAQERLNYAAGLFAEVATDVGTAWTRALFSIADGTQTVSQAFEQMAQSILRSMAEIAAQEGFKALLRLGIGLIAGGVTGGLGGGGMMGSTGLMYEGAGAGFAPATPPPIGFQHGGQVNRPTLAMIGEGAHNPEYVLNSRQMNQMMSEAVSRGASAGNQAVSIFNYPSKAAAEEAASRERSLGREVVLNEVMSDLRRGESSIINRTLRTLQR